MKRDKKGRLFVLRKINGYSQFDLAQFLNISVASYSRLENNPSGLAEERMLKLCQLYNCSLATILDIEEISNGSEISHSRYYNIYNCLQVIERQQQTHLNFLCQCLNIEPVVTHEAVKIN